MKSKKKFSMQGEYFVTVEAQSEDSEAVMDENEFC
jgi:hypothetical protein